MIGDSESGISTFSFGYQEQTLNGVADQQSQTNREGGSSLRWPTYV